ncbi:hypothetical protein FOZ60_013232 [Perkinsus olseni]|uniref:Uncharacterized protein n=1 Tax=Perkinsus olseni TaxID=32597 RepID=A0A7J6N9M8_PEROL|nr:hypothetical protein FOZ60_013232 [Perkinsus olseni]
MAEGGSSREWYLSEELTQEILDAAAARYKCAQRRFPEDRVLERGRRFLGRDSSVSMVEVKNIPEVVAEKRGSHRDGYADKRVESPSPPQNGNRSIRREPSTLDTDLPLGLLEAYEKPSSFSYSLAGTLQEPACMNVGK